MEQPDSSVTAPQTVDILGAEIMLFIVLIIVLVPGTPPMFSNTYSVKMCNLLAVNKKTPA